MLRRILGALLVAALLLPQIAPAAGQTGQAAAHRYPSVSVGGNVNAVAVQGSLAYVGEGSKFTIIDISDPTMPQPIGSIALSGPVVAVKVAGTRAYAITGFISPIADVRNKMFIIDVRTPTAPYIISSSALGKGGLSLDVVDKVVYVGRGSCCVLGQEESGLIVFDTANVLSPTVRTKFVTISEINAVRAVGTQAYIIGNTSFIVLDVSVSPAAVLGEFDLGRRATDMAVAGDYAYVTTDNGSTRSLEVLDIRTPSAIQRADSVNLSSPFPTLAVENNRAYLFGGSYTVDRDEILVMDISNPHDLSQVGRGQGGYESKDAIVINSVAYVADGSGGLRLFDASDPAAIRERGKHVLAPSPVGLWGDGERAYVTEAPRMTVPATVGIIDHSGPQPAQVGKLDQMPKAIRVIGDTAYVLTEQGLRIADVSDPAQPQWRGAITIYHPEFLEVKGNFAYVASRNYPTLSIIDISQPLTPTLRKQYDSPQGQGNYGLRVEGDRAYVVRSGIEIIDIKNPDAVARVGVVSRSMYDFAVDGTTVYTLSKDGMTLIDTSNPAAPVVGVTFPFRELPKAIAVDQGLAYVATSELNVPSAFSITSAIHILDVSDPARPRLKEWIAMNSEPSKLQLAGNRLYVNEGNNGFRVIDVTPQADPQRIFLPLVRR